MLMRRSEIICRKINGSPRFNRFKLPYGRKREKENVPGYFTFPEKWSFSKRLVLNLYYAMLRFYDENFSICTAGSGTGASETSER